MKAMCGLVSGIQVAIVIVGSLVSGMGGGPLLVEHQHMGMGTSSS